MISEPTINATLPVSTTSHSEEKIQEIKRTMVTSINNHCRLALSKDLFQEEPASPTSVKDCRPRVRFGLEPVTCTTDIVLDDDEKTLVWWGKEELQEIFAGIQKKTRRECRRGLELLDNRVSMNYRSRAKKLAIKAVLDCQAQDDKSSDEAIRVTYQRHTGLPMDRAIMIGMDDERDAK